MTAQAQDGARPAAQLYTFSSVWRIWTEGTEIICVLCLPMAGPTDGSHNLTDRDYKILAVIMLRIDRTLLLYDKPVFLLL